MPRTSTPKPAAKTPGPPALVDVELPDPPAVGDEQPDQAPPDEAVPDVAPSDASKAADEADEVDTINFEHGGIKFRVPRENMRRAAVRAGWQTNDLGLMVQGILGTEGFKAWISLHAEDDLDELLREFASAFGDAVGAGNSPS